MTGCAGERGITIKRLFLIALLLLAGACPAQAEAPLITGLRLGLNAGLTRVVIEGSEAPQGLLEALPGDPSLILTFPAAKPGAQLTAALAGGLVRRVSPLPAAGNAAVFRLELAAQAVVEHSFHLPPAHERGGHRLVIDFRPADPAAFATAFASPLRLPAESRRDVVPPPPSGHGDIRRLIVLDPGHGGQDPGAISASGRYEKYVTLAVAQAVAARLEQTGRYRVLLTRQGDRFVRLPQRVALARQKEADLFLSIHADSLTGDGVTRGASVYTRADDATDHEAESLALRENKADQLADGAAEAELDDVVSILLDLASRDTPLHASRFAGLLAASLGEVVPLRRNGLRAANFKVLAAPDVPSALLELGYLSNLKDEALLFSETGRKQLADAVVGAIDRFFGAESR